MSLNNKHNNYTIDLTGEKDNLDEQCKLFIDRLSSNYKSFKKTLKENEKKWEPYLNNDQIVFTPQEIATKSPLTIIDAPWGSGKTYFIEEVAKYFFDHQQEIKQNKEIVFERIIIIDTWKYSNSGNVVEEIMTELFSVLSSKSDKNKKNWKKVSKFFVNRIGISMLNSAFGTYIGKLDEKENFQKLIKEIEDKEPKKTIIFFDNIERLGSSAWDVLKAIQKLSYFNFFCFIFPVYYDKLNDISEGTKGEFPIDKFINLSVFKLQNNFINMLKKEGFDDDFSEVINSFLKSGDVKIYLTNRQLKEIFDHYELTNFYQEKGVFSFISKLYKIIKPNLSLNKIKEYLLEFLNSFLTSLEEQKNIFNNKVNEFDEKEIFKIIPETIKDELVVKFWYMKNNDEKEVTNELYVDKIQNLIKENLKDLKRKISEREGWN